MMTCSKDWRRYLSSCLGLVLGMACGVTRSQAGTARSTVTFDNKSGAPVPAGMWPATQAIVSRRFHPASDSGIRILQVGAVLRGVDLLHFGPPCEAFMPVTIRANP